MAVVTCEHGFRSNGPMAEIALMGETMDREKGGVK